MRHLLVPALEDPPESGLEGNEGRFGRLRRRADRHPTHQGWEETLFELLGIASPAGGDVPSAAVSFLAETGVAPDCFVFHADPVWLTVDLARVIAHRLPAQSLSSSHAESYVQAFNSHFAEQGVELVMATPEHWYLLVSGRDPEVRTSPLRDIAGRHLDPYLPQGKDAAHWHSVLNEVQMLFHGLPVSEERESSGQPAVGGLWLWGGGHLPDTPTRHVVVAGDSPVLKGFAALAPDRIRLGSPAIADVVLREEFELATERGDGVVWNAARERLEAELVEWMRAPFTLWPCSGFRYEWRPTMRFRFWR